jgi:hypothetical protein
MSANDLLERLKAIPSDTPLDIKKIRDEIHQECERATTAEERVSLLQIFNAVMDRVERGGLSPEDLEKFKAARLADYRLLLVKESLIGENVSPDLLYQATEREVAAGRMAPDDGLRQTAIEGMGTAHPSPAELLAMAEKRKTRYHWLPWRRRGTS